MDEQVNEGYENVHICCTVENQRQADIRLPVYCKVPIRHKSIICSPLLGPIDLRPYLSDSMEEVVVGGESGEEARVCDYSWVLDLRQQCVEAGVPFHFMQTGARLLKDGKCYRIPRKHQHSQARAAGIDFMIVSNNRSGSRVTEFCADLGVPYQGHAGKPSPRGLEAAMARAGTDRTHTAMLGDKLLTDMLAANRAGVLPLMVEPVGGAVTAWQKVLHALQAPFKAACRRKMEKKS